jgi:hypothetical protein
MLVKVHLLGRIHSKLCNILLGCIIIRKKREEDAIKVWFLKENSRRKYQD